MLDHNSNGLSQAVLETLAYSDIFDSPLTAHEVHKYLSGVKSSYEEVVQALTTDSRFVKTGQYFTLTGREDIVSVRKQRQARSQKLMPFALIYGRILGSLPFVRMVALTGSLAVLNVSKNGDFDYMLVTAPCRVWTARAFALLFNRCTRLFGNTICPNLIVAETSLVWPLHDLYSARELVQMIPVTGMNVYQRLMKANEWMKTFLPNSWRTSNAFETSESLVQKFLEIPFLGKFGDRFEQWEMNRKIARFSKQKGFGEETVFTPEVCQGNFHHHRKWTREVYEEKLKDYVITNHVVTKRSSALTQTATLLIDSSR